MHVLRIESKFYLKIRVEEVVNPKKSSKSHNAIQILTMFRSLGQRNRIVPLFNVLAYEQVILCSTRNICYTHRLKFYADVQLPAIASTLS